MQSASSGSEKTYVLIRKSSLLFTKKTIRENQLFFILRDKPSVTRLQLIIKE